MNRENAGHRRPVLVIFTILDFAVFSFQDFLNP